MNAKIFATLVLAGASCALGSAPAWAQTPAPERHLVYNFTYGSTGDLETHGSNGYASDTHSGSGATRDYRGSISDKGTITVDVVREQPDKGLIVSISEQAEQTRKADPATCVVYGNTTIICDSSKTVNSEEMTLLRFLGTTFVDPNQIDANRHWKIDQSNSEQALTADYTISRNADGIMSIDESRQVKYYGGASPQTNDISSKIQYDFNRLIPTSVSEFVTRRESQGPGQYMTTTIQTTLNLVSDSMAKS